MKIDVLGVTETHWSAQHRKWEQEAGGRFLCGSAPKEGDKAAGVGLRVSPSTQFGMLCDFKNDEVRKNFDEILK